MRHLADGLASLANPIGSPVDKVRVGLFRLKSLGGDTYKALQAPETSTIRQLQVTAPTQPPQPPPYAMCSLTSTRGGEFAPSDRPHPLRMLLVRGSCFHMHFRVCPFSVVSCWSLELHCSGCHNTLRARAKCRPSPVRLITYLPHFFRTEISFRSERARFATVAAEPIRGCLAPAAAPCAHRHGGSRGAAAAMRRQLWQHVVATWDPPCRRTASQPAADISEMCARLDHFAGSGAMPGTEVLVKPASLRDGAAQCDVERRLTWPSPLGQSCRASWCRRRASAQTSSTGSSAPSWAASSSTPSCVRRRG